MSARITILFTTRASKARTSGLSPIQVQLTKDGVRASFSIGHAVKPSEWDNKNQRVRGSSDEANAINDHLHLLRTRLYHKENELLERGYIVNADILRDAILDRIDI